VSLTQRVAIAIAIAAVLCGCDDALRPQIVDPIYEEPCRYTDCSGHGECVTADAGAPLCLCDVGYDTESCSRCEPGFHRDASERCIPDRRCAEQTSDPCAPGGECGDVDGVIECLCAAAYAGPRCTLCASGYARDPLLGCVIAACPMNDAGDASAPTDASDALDASDAAHASDAADALDAVAPIDAAPCRDGETQTMDFAPQGDWPLEINTCRATAEFSDAQTILRSEQGDVAALMCADTNFNGFTTRHVQLSAAPTRAAEIELPAAVASISFDYASRLQPLSLTVLADGREVGTIELAAVSHATLTLALDPPATTIGFRSRTVYAQGISLDNLVWQFGECL